jgi:hypothetical protein
MKISFFEEFPYKKGVWEKLKIINFPTKLYIALHSIKELRKFEKKLNLPLGYWILLKKWEGYWISPFSVRSGLIRVFNEVKDEEIEVMLDLEPPVHAPWLYIIGGINFFKNKQLIENFIKNRSKKKLPTTLVEMKGREEKLKSWGLSYQVEEVFHIKMVYTSLLPYLRKKQKKILEEVCKEGVKRYGNYFKIGLGCIAKGISRIEPILSPERLEEDIKIAKLCGVKEAVIFRLEGMNLEYLESINRVIN